MYNFNNLKKGTTDDYSLPSEAMKFEGVYLEDEIDGYKTLSVSGRELLAYDVSSHPISGSDGATFLGATLPSRTLSVKYQLEAESPEDMRDKYNLMNQILSTKQAVISFNDEPNYEFIGTLGSSSAIPEGRLNVVGSFDILCVDPYKYKLAEEHTGTGSITIKQPMAEPVVVDEIIIRPPAITDVFEITNETSGLTLRIINASENTNNIHIYPKTQKIIRTNVERPELLDWVSDFENFTVNDGDTLTIMPTDTNFTIKLRERLR